MALPSFGLVLKGDCWLAVNNCNPLRFAAGDFFLVPGDVSVTICSDLESDIVSLDAQNQAPCQSGETSCGDPGIEVDFKLFGGHFQLDSANNSLLGNLLSSLVHIQASDPTAGRLRRLIDLIVEEALGARQGRDMIVDRLIEVLLVEVLRFGAETTRAIGQRGLLAGLADPLLARALREFHSDVARAWSVEDLARVAGLSRSAFCKRFTQKLGTPPMQYLIDWRIALAKSMLERDAPPLETVAAAIGYQSASAFSTAFRREVGNAPGHFARNAIE